MIVKFRIVSLFILAVMFIFTACSNNSSSKKYNATPEDNTAPVITLKGKSPMEIIVGGAYHEEGATAIDDVDGKVKVSIDSSDINVKKVGIYKVKYTARDKSNNIGIAVRVVKVVTKDTTKPVITITTPDTIKEGESLTPSATATDNGEDIDVTISGDKVTDTTPPGRYSITYKAEDKAGNITEVKKSVTVEPLTVTELLTAAAEGRDGVTYHVVGDSTRNYPGQHLTSLVDDYYPNGLAEIGVEFSHTAMGGQRAYKWLNNSSTSHRFNYIDTMEAIPDNSDYVEQRNYILEFSLGINDARDNNYDTVFKTIRDSIKKLQQDRKYMKILLVSPVPHEQDGRYVSGEQFEEIYKQVAEEFNLPWVSGKKALQYYFDNKRSDYYHDSVHPNAKGSKILFNYIFKHIATSDIYEQIKQ